MKPVSEPEIKYQGKIMEVVQQQVRVGEGKEVTFEWARRAPGVRMIIISKDGKDVLLTKEFRRELDGYDYRLPGGKVYDTLDEFNQALENKADIAAAAADKVKAEGREEAGLDILTATPIHVSKLGTTVEWDLHYFVVSEFEEHPDGQDLEHGEDITREWVPIAQARDMALNGQMSEERSALVLLRALQDK
jgi:ADP-ribose pyrophosphatase